MMAKARNFSSHTAGAPKKRLKYMEPSYFKTLNILAVSVPICIIGLIANAIVLCLYCCRIKKTKLGPYFFSVILANIIIILCNLEVVAFIIGGVKTSLVLQNILELIHMFLYNTNLYIITFLTADRFLIVYYPLWWQVHRTKHFTLTMCVILYFISGLQSLLEYVSCYGTSNAWAYNTCRTASMLALIIEIVISSSCIFCCTLAIWIRTRKQPARVDATTVGVAILFLFLTVPVRLVNIISVWVRLIDYNMFSVISLLLDSCASCSIPFVFLIVGTWSKRQASQTFCMFLERALKDSEDTSETSVADQELA